MANWNKYGEIEHTCQIPSLKSNLGDVPYVNLIELLPLVCNTLIALQKNSQTQSKAL